MSPTPTASSHPSLGHRPRCIVHARARATGVGIININPANATHTSEEGNNDTSSLDKDIITIAHAEFEVN